MRTNHLGKPMFDLRKHFGRASHEGYFKTDFSFVWPRDFFYNSVWVPIWEEQNAVGRAIWNILNREAK